MAQQDPWSGLDTLAPKKPEKADPWAGFDAEASTAVADFGDLPEDPGVPEQPGAGQYALGLVESGVRGAELSLGSVLDMVGGSGRRILDTYFPGDLTRAEKKRREERARKPGKDLKAYAEKEHPAPQDYPNKLMEGLGGVAPYLVAGAVTGGAGTPAILGTMGAQHISSAYDQALEATGSEAKATEAAIANIPGAAASMLPFGRILGKLAGTTPAVGGIVKEALAGAVSGTIGNGTARVLGDIVHEQVTGEDREILKTALEGVAIDAPLFAFLGAVAGVSAKKPAGAAAGLAADKKVANGGKVATEPLGPDDVQLGKPPTGPLNPELTGVSQKLTASEPEAHGDAPPTIAQAEPSKPLWEMSLEELREGRAKKAAEVASADVEVFGEEGARRYQQLLKRENSSNREAADKASTERQAMEDSVTQEQRNKLFGIGDEGPQVEDFQAYERALEGVEIGGTEAELGRSLRWAVSELGQESGPAKMSDKQRQRYAQIRIAVEDARARGLDVNTIEQEALKGAVERFKDPEDAIFMLRRFLKPQGERMAETASEPHQAQIVEPAKPQEAAGPEQSPTSTKNATVETERAARGMAPVEQEAARDFGTVWDEAKTKLEEDPTLGDRVVAGEKLQALSADTRNAVLLRTQIEAQNEHKRVSDSLLKAQESGDADAVEALTAQHSKVSDRLLDIYNASKREGTEAGRGLNARRMMANEDFSLAAVETQMRIAKGGEKLTPEEQAKAASLSERLIAAERDVDAIEAAIAAKTADREARTVKASPQKQGRVLQFVSAQAEAARARIKARGSRAMAGLDPVDAADRVIVGVEYLAKDISAFVDWSSAMVKEFGEAIQPHLEDLFSRAKTAYSDSIRKSGALQGYKTRTAGTIEKLKGKIESEDFEPAPKRAPLPLDPEALKLKTNLEEVKLEYQHALQDFRFKNRTTGQKVKDVATEALDLPKALMTAYDFSAVLRQGAFFSLDPKNAPKLAKDWVPKMFQATFSERKALEIDVALRNRPNAALGETAKLELTRHGDDIGKHEEAIRSKWSDKIPGIKASNRAFITFLNVQRASVFDAMVDAVPGGATPEQAKVLANGVNVGTGRGNPGKFAGAVSAASHVLWSPRLLLSRFQLLAGQPLYRGDATTRKIIAKQYARSLVGLGAVYALAKLSGAEVEDDPRSSDFGKLRFGDTRLDPLAGLSQVTVLGSRLTTGETKTLSGKVNPIRGDVPYGQANSFEVTARFLRTKLSPTLGTAFDVLSGKNAVGEEVTPGSAAVNLAVPLSFQDILDAMEDQGIERGAALATLSIFGMGLMHYKDKKREARVLSEVK